MEYTGGIEVQGLQEVLKSFDTQSKATRTGAMKGLQKWGMNVIEDAMINLGNNGSVVTGLLRSSGKVQKKSDTELDIGFFDKKNQSGYAAWVEYGRKAGKMPPPDVLAAYIKKRHSFKNNAIRAAAAFTGKSEEQMIMSAAYAMAVKIAKEGTKAHPFFVPAIEKNKSKMAELISEYIKKETDGEQ